MLLLCCFHITIFFFLLEFESYDLAIYKSELGLLFELGLVSQIVNVG